MASCLQLPFGIDILYPYFYIYSRVETTMKYPLLTLALSLVTHQGHALSGQVLDEQGKPVTNAQIEVVGDNKRYTTDSSGQFIIPHESVDEIHVKAPGFSHKILHLHHQHEQDKINIELLRGVLEVVDVIGVPLHTSKIESAQPVSVLAGQNLRKKQAATLGETLKREIGVQSSYYGGVASSPIIRGLDGPRVLITQNGLDVSDASRVGPDHVVATEASTAEQIEILRGPATLFYGSGAIGGVVNVVDDRIPTDSLAKGAFVAEYQSVSDASALSGAYTGGNEIVAFHVDGFWRDRDDYEIPGAAELETEEEHEEEGHDEHDDETLENSASESYGFNLGGSLLFDNGHIGLSYGRLDRLNGVPGHGHEEEGEEHDDEMEEEGHDEDGHEEEEENILSDLEQDRWQLISEFHLDGPHIASISTRMGYTDYQHAEIHDEDEEGHDEDEDGDSHDEEFEEGTVFKNKTWQIKTDIVHNEIARWKGAISLEIKNTDFEAIGEEAFTPPSETREMSLAIVEERHAGNILWQLGARIDNVTIKAIDQELDFTPISASAGLVWDFNEGYNIGASLTHAERAPSAAEIFSNGPHIATRAFEAGALFTVEQNNNQIELAAGNTASIDKETSNNVDLSLRKFEGNIGFVFNVFYNQVDNYYALINTGLTTAQLDGDAEEIFPIYLFEQSDATISGLEAEFVWQFQPNFKWTIWGDTVNAKLKGGEYLPRTSPTRLSTQLNFDQGPWSAETSVTRYFEQDNIASNETSTEAYTLLDARVSYDLPLTGYDSNVYLAADNLTDEEARVHTSFLKDQAPLPGRNLKLGFQLSF